MSDVPKPPNADHLNAIQEAAKQKEADRMQKADVKDTACSSGLHKVENINLLGT